MNITTMKFLDIPRSEVPQELVWELVNHHVEYRDYENREHIYSLGLVDDESASPELKEFIKQLCKYDEEACYFRLLQ